MQSRSRLLASLAVGCLGALAAAPAAGASSCADAETLASGQTVAQVEQSVLCLVNEERDTAGIAQVRANEKLRRAASRHSRDMVSDGFFAHTSPAGDSFIDRITATGYMRGARSWLVGENLAWGSGKRTTPASVVAAWMHSPPHRANLLRPRFREIGISAVRGTPSETTNGEGVIVSSEYGYREIGKKSRKAKNSQKAS
jgi:uncharacterized protein YkwD